MVLAAAAAATTGAVVAVEFARVWRRGRAPLPAEAEEPLRAAAEAAAETAEVAIVGYREASTRENALFNLLASFVVIVHHRAVGHLPAARAAVGRAVPQRQGRAGATSTTSCPGSRWRSPPAGWPS